MVIGAAVGAIAGALIYTATTIASGREWDNGDLLVSAATGAVGGALIGTGFGASAGIAAFAAMGAGTGILGSQAGYSLTSGTSYNSGEMVINAGVGGVTGSISGAVLGGVGIGMVGRPAWAIAEASTKVMIANAMINGAGSTAQYELMERYNGRDPTWGGRGMAFASGGASSIIMDGLMGTGIDSKAMKSFFTSEQPYYSLFINGHPSGLTRYLFQEAVSQGIRTTSTDLTTRFLTPLITPR